MATAGIALDVRPTPGLQEFSQLAGPVESPPTDGVYRVRYRSMRSDRRKRQLLLVACTLAVEAFFVAWLLHPAHRPEVTGSAFVVGAHYFLIGSIALMELLRLINVVSLSVASVLARDPIPVHPDTSLRVAFLTTIVPSKEPVDVVAATLAAARRINYDGQLDVWILDEGDDDAVKAMARDLGVRHFSRKGIERYNTRSGAFRAKTKHGNYNAWMDAHGDEYDVFLSVDPDHVPLPNYAERILGYFRDPDVAYVVGPQCYRNTGTFVTRGAESQQFPFHSVVQRAANRYDAAMLVGTNNAVRISALRATGGLSDSITEDMATGLNLHSLANPATGGRWKSVYTPDVLAAGEGPSSWADYFSQQMRWSRGTFEILLTTFWRRFVRLSPGRMLHYAMITTFYPSMALGWILGAANAILILAFGASGIVVPPEIWIALYVDVTAFQLILYFSNRRYNVSPYERENSTGLGGIVMSIIAAPMYASQLVATVLRRPARFVVTPKGTSSNRDSLFAFRLHIGWFVLLAATLVVAAVRDQTTPFAVAWVIVTMLICVAPLIQWRQEQWLVRRQPTRAASSEPAYVEIEAPLRAAPTTARVAAKVPAPNRAGARMKDRLAGLPLRTRTSPALRDRATRARAGLSLLVNHSVMSPALDELAKWTWRATALVASLQTPSQSWPGPSLAPLPAPRLKEEHDGVERQDRVAA